MLYLKKLLCLFFVMLLLVQPVFAESEPETVPTEPFHADIISAIRTVEEIPINWSPLSPMTEERQWLLQKTTAPVYRLEHSGDWTPVLAGSLPVDVTADYAGSFGIPADAHGAYAYSVQLNSEARWDDGLIITADDYLFSIQKLLEDEENRQNWLFLANASAILSDKRTPNGDVLRLRETEFSGVSEALNAGITDFYVDTTKFWGLDQGWMPITDRTPIQDFAMPDGMDERFVSPAYLYKQYLESGKENDRFQREFIGISKTYRKVTMEDLGIIKTGPFELVFVLQDPLAPSTFMQKLNNLFLIRQSCWSKDFATSPATYCGYGLYRITSADAHQIILEPNEYWWGEPVSDDFHRIICRKG